LQRASQVRTQGVERGHSANQETHKRGCGERVSERRGIDANCAEPWQTRRAQSDERAYAEQRYGDTEHSTDEGEEHPFGNELLEQPAPPRAERRAHHKFALPLCTARKQQVG